MADTKIQHHVFTWLVKNVYLCEKLLYSYIEGPEFEAFGEAKISWTLKLGQNPSSKEKGIRLIVMRNDCNEVLVNFRLYVREQTNPEPFLDKKYRALFSKDKTWSSPVLLSNEEFANMYKISKKLSNFWDIRVELMYEEKKLLKTEQNASKLFGNLAEKRMVGIDLEKFYDNKELSDFFFELHDVQVNIHKPILQARCSYFADLFKEKEYCEKSDITLDFLKDDDVLRYFLKYLYTGNIHTLEEMGPLPIGIYQCAKRMHMQDLEWLTEPCEFSGITCIDCDSTYFEFRIDGFNKFIKNDHSNPIKSTAFVNGIYERFRLEVDIVSEASNVSVFLNMEIVTGGQRSPVESVYVFLKVSILSLQDKIVHSRKIAGNLKPGHSLGFLEFVSTNELLKRKNWMPHGMLNLVCEMKYSTGKFENIVENVFTKCEFGSLDESTEQTFDPCCAISNGYRTLCRDFGDILKNSLYSDCIVTTGDQNFPAHKVILAARSPYFRKKISDIEKFENMKVEKFEIMDVEKFEIMDVEKFEKMKVKKIKVEKGEKIEVGACQGLGLTEGDAKKICVITEVCDAIHMKIILEEIYTGSAEVHGTEAEEVHRLAEIFGLSSLARKCVRNMESS